MLKDGKIYVGKSGDEELYIYPAMANRHGLIAGATGTGKTTTLKVIAESFSDMGVPVFLADLKGDLASLGVAGSDNEKLLQRLDALKLREAGYEYSSYPVNIWDVYQETGIPLRTTVSEMGPVILSSILGLNDIQSDILTIIFKIADDEDILLVDTKDLKAMIKYVGENAKKYSATYGNIASVSLAAITRGVVAIESEGAELFFGEPTLSVKDWIATDTNGKGMIQVMDCAKLSLNPRMYSMFLLWLISELYENLPEAGDLPKPKMVFFFDEAHMLFDTASKTLLEKIEQVIKLIRSKGVGIFFITQNPKDIPDGVLAQLGNKVQHALHAYTPNEQKGAKAAAQSFRENPDFDTYTVLQELATGEALISVLDEKGVPTVVKRATILPPQSFMGTLQASERNSLINNSSLYSKYAQNVDNYTAYEHFNDEQKKQEEEEKAAEEEAAKAAEEKEKEKEQLNATQQKQKEIAAKKKQITKVAKSVASTTGSTVGRQIGKTLGSNFGTFGKTLGGNIGSSLGRGILGSFFKS